MERYGLERTSGRSTAHALVFEFLSRTYMYTHTHDSVCRLVEIRGGNGRSSYSNSDNQHNNNNQVIVNANCGNHGVNSITIITCGSDSTIHSNNHANLAASIDGRGER